MMEKWIDRLQRVIKPLYVLVVIAVAVATVAVLLLLQNISTRMRESRDVVFKIVDLDETTVDPAEWGKNFPRQYDSYRRTVDIQRTRYGGSESFQRLDRYPNLRLIFKGYPFSRDYREERGHAYMLSDQDTTERVKRFAQPGACLHCHASVIPAYRRQGRQAGVPDDQPLQQVLKGFEIVSAMPYAQARKLVTHPVSCLDCHDPKTMQLRVTRPGFILAVRELAKSTDALGHMPSIERWRKGPRTKEYDVNQLASRQEMRSFVCGQCHVEYYFTKKGKLVTYPWPNGLKVEQIETYYDGAGFYDWTHPDTGAEVLKAQHPEFEMWNQGVHARSGVACADCHMPYKREGAIKVSDHHVRSPRLSLNRSCQTCHNFPESELQQRVDIIQDRTAALLSRAERAVVDLIGTIEKARKTGVAENRLKTARNLHRKAQWRFDFVSAENSMGFHADQEAARILAEAIDYARQGQVEAAMLLPPSTQPSAP